MSAQSSVIQPRQDSVVGDLCAILGEYMKPTEMSNIYKAYLFGAEAHENQKRLSGEPYISHPIQVAQTMADLRLDAVTISAGLLHDVIEDTHITKEKLSAEFGPEVAEVVDGVSKLPKLEFESKEVGQAKNFQKMLLAMTNDPRVILVKLSDRLHNMRTLNYLPIEKRKRIAYETLEIYAPLAQRLGMDKIRLELEDLAFKVLYPMRYAVLEKAMRNRGDRQLLMDKMLEKIRHHLDGAGFFYHAYGRRKHLYSIYRKMKERNYSLSQIFDFFAVRIIVGNVDHCYRVLGMLHNLFKPVPGRFKDYIALPKMNGYQSLHTVLCGLQGMRLEAQIRTPEMDEMAESGIAAHVSYKTGEPLGQDKTHRWMQSLLSLQQKTGSDSTEYMEQLKAELFPDEVYVFTPQGEIIVLPRKSTALDFAFAIHTDIGLSTMAVRVNGKAEELNFQLSSGQTVEVITASRPRPDSRWLEFAVTAKARSAILHYLKHIESEKAITLGQYLLQQTLQNYDIDLSNIAPTRIKELLASLELPNETALYKEIGLGTYLPSLIVARLVDVKQADKQLSLEIDTAATSDNAKGMVMVCAKCCYPVPGDAIIGLMSPGKGLVLHRATCTNVLHNKRGKSEIILVNWSDNQTSSQEYSAAIRIVVPHQRGVLATLASQIAQMGSNIENVSLDDQGASNVAITFIISVPNKNQLDKVMRRLSRVYEVVKVVRIGTKEEPEH